LSSPAFPFVTAGLRPEFFSDAGTRALPRTLLILALSVLVIAGFALRAHNLTSEGLSEDELNKLNAVSDYRAHGLTSANGEHPLLMKALLTVSVIGAERWNQTSLVAGHPDLNIPVEMSLRLPSALFGAATAVLLFLIASELFGLEIGLLSAALWAFDPLTIGLNRIAKEDTFLVFFFLLALFFWLRGQRVAESQPQRNPERYYWATAMALGAMMASKLIPILISIPVAYNYVFQNIPATRWVIGKKRFIKFFIILGITFVVLSPTILFPGTWKAIANFTSYRAMGHDSYEFMGRLYTHKFADWLSGQPWYFYIVLLATKLPVLSLAGFAGGMALLFRRKTGEGRYLLLMWLALWSIGFVVVGGKFMRYITSLMPVVMIISAMGIQFVARKFGRLCAHLAGNDSVKVYARAILPSLVILATFWSATNASPHYRLYVNSMTGGATKAGAYFPQDEFYDAYMRDALREIAKLAQPQAIVVSELDTVSAYYAQRSNRPDLVSLDLSDPGTVSKLRVGDFLIDARGRTYLSNQAMLARLRAVGRPAFTISVGTTPAADVYVLDQKSLAALSGK
jgi:predicted membrane-bound dolichyl-phosphate-mannose-protein mannosyltransferase